MQPANLTSKIEEIGNSNYENEFGNNIVAFDNVFDHGISSAGSDGISNGNLNASCVSKNKNNNKNNSNVNLLDVNKPRKSSFVQKNLELHLSDTQRSKIEAILNSVKELTDTEKLLLYLKLPTREHDAPSTTNTKQEQTFAFQWIRNNLEECDSSVNLPKHEVYDEYRSYCEAESLTRFLSAPDFGKIVKCIYPNVKARRLGTRGNSKYCYNGLQRKVVLESHCVTQPDCIIPPENNVVIDCKNIKLEEDEKVCDQTYAAASVLVCEWANKLLGRVFETLIGLAKFLVSGSYVSTKSMASFIIMSASGESISKINSRYSLDTLVNSSTIPNKNHAIKTELVSPLTLSNYSPTTDVVSIQSNEVNSTSDVKDKSISNFIPSVGVQVVPDMPTQNSELPNGSNQQCSKLKLNEFTIDVSSPVYLGESISHSSLPGKLSEEDILMDNVNFVIMDKKQNTNLNIVNSGNSKLNQDNESEIPNVSQTKPKILHNTIGDVKRRKRRIDQLQLTTPCSKSYKTSTQSQISKKDLNGFHPQSSFAGYQSMPGPSAVVGMQMQRNQFLSWPISSENVVATPEVTVSNYISNETQLELVSNIQRCHSVPMVKTKCVETYQPLTPQFNVHTVFNSKVKQTFKAKRNLFNMFNNNTHASSVNVTGNELFLGNNGASLQNVPNIMPLSSKPNIERVVPSEPLKNVQAFSTVDISMQDDDFSGIASNLDHVDGHELLKTFQTSENWINDWSNMTMPVMNFS